jgi:hypothetical protein
MYKKYLIFLPHYCIFSLLKGVILAHEKAAIITEITRVKL